MLYLSLSPPPFFLLITLVYMQRHKSSYPVYPKADPTPVTSSAPPVSTLYSSPVVSIWMVLEYVKCGFRCCNERCDLKEEGFV